MSTPKTTELVGLDVDTVRKMLEQGMQNIEIAVAFCVSSNAIGHFIHHNEIQAFNGKPAKPDLSRTDRVTLQVVGRDPKTGARRIKRIPLPRISMHVAALENANG